MNTQSEVVRLTKLCQRQRATIRRLEQERDEAAWKVDAYAAAFASHVKHPQQAGPGWTPPPHEAQTTDLRFVGGGIFAPPQSLWQRIKSWVTG